MIYAIQQRFERRFIFPSPLHMSKSAKDVPRVVIVGAGYVLSVVGQFAGIAIIAFAVPR